MSSEIIKRLCEVYMKQAIKNSLYFIWIIPAILMWSCSSDSEVVPVLKLSADKTSIKANNKDKVIFSVTVDDIEVTSSVTITQKGKITPVDEMSFSTDSVASYIFFATYHNVKSNEITIEAVDIEILITADKQSIKANNKDIVTFSVKADGEDVTSSAIIIEVGSPDSTLADSGFYTKTVGPHTFYAMYNGKRTNEIRIDASGVIFTLSVDKTTIKANNSDKALFTVMADDENVTSSVKVMQIKNGGDEAIDNQEFFTDKAALYTFYAIYEGEKSNEIDIEATFVELIFLRGYSIVQISSNMCPICPLMTDELRKIQQSLPGQIHVITLHPYGKYCNSELAGALAETAISFADRVKYIVPPPPLAIVDLNDPVNLYERDTQKPLSDALNRATLARDRVSLTGIAVKSKVNGSMIDFEVNIKTVKTADYRFFAFVVEDGVVYRQVLKNAIIDYNYVHNNLATFLLTEGDPFMGVNLGTVIQNNETNRSFSINTDNFNTGRDVNFDNCRIVCYTLRSNDGRSYFVDNVTTCPVNGSVRYLYEK